MTKNLFGYHYEEEVAGYADAMELIFKSYNEIPINENHIKQLHQVLLKHSSKDANIEDNKDQCYLSLRRSQSTLYTDNAKLNEWILFFLGSLRKQVSVLESKIETERIIAQVPPLSQEILRIAGQHGRIMVRDAEKITNANRNTIKAHISELVRKGRLQMLGKGKGTWYKIP